MRNKTKKSPVSLIVIVLILFVVFKSQFSDDDSSQVQSGNTQSGSNQGHNSTPATPSAQAKSTKLNYALRPTANDWPSSQTEQSGVSLAENLTASNYYLVLDGSGSMADAKCSGDMTKMQAAKQAVSAFITQIPETALMGLVVFDTRGTSERVMLGSNNRQRMLNEISAVSADGGTPLRSSIKHAYQSLEQQAKKQLGYGDYHLVVITDGEASSKQEPDQVVDEILSSSPVVVHTIGFCISGGHSLNQPGRIDYKQANDPDSLRQGLEAVLAESPDFQQDSFQ